MQPSYKITIDGKDITKPLTKRLTLLELIDKRGLEADQLLLTISDGGAEVERVTLPQDPKTIACAIGWKGKSLSDKGKFVIDEVEYSGSPDKIIIRAHSAFSPGLLERKERTWREKTLGDIMKTIGGEHGFNVKVAQSLASEMVGQSSLEAKIGHMDQTDESNANFLTRLGCLYDAIVTIKDKKLLMLPAGGGESVSGQAFTPIELTKADVNADFYSESGSANKYTGVKACWDDKAEAKKMSVTVGAAGELRVLQNYANEAEATLAAKAEWQRIQRAKQTMDITLAYGRTDIFPETPVRLKDWKVPISSVNWLTTEVIHRIDGTGFISRLSLESQL